MGRLTGSLGPKNSACQSAKENQTRNKTHSTSQIVLITSSSSQKPRHHSSIIYIFNPTQHGRGAGLSHPEYKSNPWEIRDLVSSQAQEKSREVGHSEHAQNKTAGGISGWEENDGAPWPLNDSKNPVKTTQDPPMILLSKKAQKKSWSDAGARLVVFYSN
jgi:hypothetical protein